MSTSRYRRSGLISCRDHKGVSNVSLEIYSIIDLQGCKEKLILSKKKDEKRTGTSGVTEVSVDELTNEVDATSERIEGILVQEHCSSSDNLGGERNVVAEKCVLEQSLNLSHSCRGINNVYI